MRSKINILLNLSGVMSFVGAVATIYPALSDPKLYAIVAMLVTCAFCFLLASNYYERFKISRVLISELEFEIIEKNQFIKESEDVIEELNKLVHRIHTSIEKMYNADDYGEVEQVYALGLRQVLNASTSIFSIVTSQNCSSSMMLKDQHEKCHTVMYCSKANPNREIEESKPLHYKEGFVGRAFDHNLPQIWDVNDVSFFIPTRDNFTKYYKTGLSVPVFCNKAPRAVLNIDSLVVGAFSEGMFNLADTIGHALAILLAYHDEILAAGEE